VEDERRPPEDSNKRRGSSRRLSFSAHPASDSDVSEHEERGTHTFKELITTKSKIILKYNVS